MNKMIDMQKAVRIISDPKIIKLLSNPLRMEILRQTTQKPKTQSQLAKLLNLSKPSIGHHFHLLRDTGLIKIIDRKIGPHGIVEKYYKSTSDLFIVDFEKIPERFRKYFLQVHIERLRGILSALQLVGFWKDQGKEILSEQLKELAEDIAKYVSHVGEKYQKKEDYVGRENLLISIYTEALKTIVNLDKWSTFFSGISERKDRK